MLNMTLGNKVDSSGPSAGVTGHDDNELRDDGVSNAAGAFLREGPPEEQDGVQDPRVVIVGAGCFGLSTAYHLLMRGYGDVTVLDRSPVLPAPDASSNDINRSGFSIFPLLIQLAVCTSTAARLELSAL